MFLSLLKSAEWKPFKDLLSPSFFDVVPATVLFGQATALTRNYRDAMQFAAAKSARSSTLAASRLPVRLTSTLPSSAAGALDSKRRGSLVLELYFHQVLSGGAVLLDLRSTTFAAEGDALSWNPAPGVHCVRT